MALSDVPVRFEISDHFSSLPSDMRETFIDKHNDLNALLYPTDLCLYFLTDKHRGGRTVRAYLQTRTMETFTAEDRIYGGAFKDFCHLYHVSKCKCIYFRYPWLLYCLFGKRLTSQSQLPTREFFRALAEPFVLAILVMRHVLTVRHAVRAHSFEG